MNGCGDPWYYRVTKESNMEYIGRKSSGKGQIVRVGSGFQSKRNWPELPDYVPDLSLPIGEPLMDNEPRFLFENVFSVFWGGNPTGPDMSQPVWKHEWVTPAVMYSTRDTTLLVRNVDYFVNEVITKTIPYMLNSMYSIGRNDFDYAIRNFTWGFPVWQQEYDSPNSFLFWNRPEERPSILGGLNFGMWSKNGIDNNRDWDFEFYSKLKNALLNLGVKSPYFCYFDNEIGVDFYAGSSVYPLSGSLSSMPCNHQYTSNDIGYISCCLQDSRSSNSDFLVDGQRTFQQYWNEALYRDGGDWPCLDFSIDGYNRSPKVFEGFWRSASLYTTSNAYCLWKGGCEPALSYFPNMIFANALSSGPSKYSRQTKIGVQNTSLKSMNGYNVHQNSPILSNLMQSPGFYNFAPDYSLYTTEDLSNYYNTGLSAIDPRLATFKNFMTYDFVNYYPSDFTDWNWFRMQHMRRGFYNLVCSGGKTYPPCPWLSAWTYRNEGSLQSYFASYDKNNSMFSQFVRVWVEALKYAISIGIRQFGIWEGTYDSATMNFWNDVLVEVKDWYDNVFKKQISIYI